MGTRAPKRVVAIADPFPDEAELYELAFGAAGFVMHSLPADDAPRAAEVVVSSGADLVVTRILPRRFGIELVRRLRSDDRTAKVPIIVLTTYPDPALHAEARTLGANDLLLLPVDPEDLIHRARQLIGH